MQQIITAKLKLLTTPEQHQLLRQNQLAYRDALNYVSRYAFENGKISNNERLQQGTYHEIRVFFDLPSQMACNVPRRERAFCQYALMRRTVRPKWHASRAMPNCGGVRMRAPPERERSTALDGPRVNDLPIEWGGL